MKWCRQCKDGRFHVYPVSTVDEGIELLTGIQAGERDEKGMYPQDTLNHAVQARLKELAETVKKFSFSVDGGKGNGK
jgi:predicted ATP-dependent protease